MTNKDWENVVDCYFIPRFEYYKVHDGRAFDMKTYVAWLNELRCYGLKYADLPTKTLKKLMPVALELTRFEYTELAKLLKSSKNLPKSSTTQRFFNESILKYL